MFRKLIYSGLCAALVILAFTGCDNGDPGAPPPLGFAAWTTGSAAGSAAAGSAAAGSAAAGSAAVAQVGSGSAAQTEGSAAATGVLAAITTDTTLKVGDAVDGLWTNNRWYPGRIGAVHADGTFRVNYNDGDVSP